MNIFEFIESLNLRGIDPDNIDDVFIDLDGVAADFEHGSTAAGLEPDIFKRQAGSYIWLPPVAESVEAIKYLMLIMPGRVWFLTKPPKFTPYAYVEKALWVQRYFGDDGLHALIVTQDKSLVGTKKSVLVDDRPHKANVEKFRGVVIHFLSEKYPTWREVLQFFANVEENSKCPVCQGAGEKHVPGGCAGGYGGEIYERCYACHGTGKK